ncbi:hypothetical protein OH492_18960 [Vibrio chagasii]|nr:hypothetical protein [Vibrio chagasii]
MARITCGRNRYREQGIYEDGIPGVKLMTVEESLLHRPVRSLPRARPMGTQ